MNIPPSCHLPEREPGLTSRRMRFFPTPLRIWLPDGRHRQPAYGADRRKWHSARRWWCMAGSGHFDVARVHPRPTEVVDRWKGGRGRQCEFVAGVGAVERAVSAEARRIRGGRAVVFLVRNRGELITLGSAGRFSATRGSPGGPIPWAGRRFWSEPGFQFRGSAAPPAQPLSLQE